ncbi:MAG TPA: hypothetical protein VLW17_02835, partial [Thermoanaerobaculaceae bacterium]|nr:hypothetical protein [Thermoanaerobaculaceae bacterium]
MRVFHNTHFQFMKYRWHWIAISTALNLIAIALIFTRGFALGVDFAGGTQLTLKFKTEPDLGRVRKALEDLKMGNVSIQRFDEPELHQILVHLQNPKSEGDFSAHMLGALEKEYGSAAGKLEINLQGADALTDALAQADPDNTGGTIDEKRAHYKPMAADVLGLRKRVGIISGAAELSGLTALSPAVRTYLGSNAHFGDF